MNSNRYRPKPYLDELLYPVSGDFLGEVTKFLKISFQARLFTLLWQAYDELLIDMRGFDFKLIDTRIEDSISRALVHRIQCRMNNTEPFLVNTQVEETASRKSERGSCPTYDIACTLKRNARLIYPLEAKVVRDARGVGAYLSEIQNNFLTGRYAPFCTEGGMIGYLIGVAAAPTYNSIGVASGFKLEVYQDCPRRPHWTSKHARPKSLLLPSLSNEFCCHHLLMEFTD